MSSEISRGRISIKGWVLIILFSILISLSCNFISIMQTPALVRVFTIGPWGDWMFMPAPFLVLGIILLVSRISSFRSILSSQVLGLIYVSTVMSIVLGFENFPWRQLGGLTVFPRLSANSKWLPSLLCPSAEVTRGMLLGGMAVPWAEWGVPIMYWIAQYGLLLLYVASLSNLLRRQWIDVEQLPYPYVEAAVQLVRPITELEAEAANARVKRIIIGVMAAIILYTPYVLNRLFAWFPDIYGWGNFTVYISWLAGTIDLARAYKPLADSIIGLTAFNWNFLFFAIALLLPVNIMQSYIIAWLIFDIILPQIQFTMGAYSGITTVSWGYTRIGNMCFSPPLLYEAFNSLGVLPGILIMSIAVNWRYVVTIFKAIKSGSPGDGEPLPYRISFILLIVSGILLLAIFAMVSINILTGIMLLIFLAIYPLAFARLHGLSLLTGTSQYYSVGFLRWLWPDRTMETTTHDYVLANVWCTYWGMAQYPPNGTTLFFFDCYKMASLTKLDNKLVFKTAVLCALISLIISIPLYVAVGYTLGLGKIPFTNGGAGDSFYIGLPSYVNIYPSAIAWWPWSLAGLITAAALTILSQRFVWWPLHPIGVYIATSRPLWYSGWWSNVAVALVLKLSILRIGGVKTYEEWVLPIIAGFLVGYTFISVAGGIVGIYRFFYPF